MDEGGDMGADGERERPRPLAGREALENSRLGGRVVKGDRRRSIQSRAPFVS